MNRWQSVPARDPDRPTRVMLVDDHDMVRRGLAVYLQIRSDLKLTGEASNGREAVELCARLQPDVVLMDLVMPEMDGATATQVIRSRWPHVQVIALTSFQDRDMVQKVLQAGAISYLMKNVTGDDLAAAIRAACMGRSTLAPEAAQVLIQAANQGPAPGHDLTEREREVLGLLVSGMTNPQIATHLCISRSTARAHVSKILDKLGATNRAEAVSTALRHKLVA